VFNTPCFGVASEGYVGQMRLSKTQTPNANLAARAGQLPPLSPGQAEALHF
jgi:hypothetical protein